MAQPVQARPITNDEGDRLLRIVRRGTGSVVTWRRAQMVLLWAQGMPVAKTRRGHGHQHRPGPRRAAQRHRRRVGLVVSALCRRSAAEV